MSLKTLWSTLLLLMSLNSPYARGEKDVINPFMAIVSAECSQTFADRLAEILPGISAVNRVRLASTLCQDERVFWPFAQALDPEIALPYEESYRSQAAYAPPITIGLTGVSNAKANAVALALNRLLYVPWAEVHQWNGDELRTVTWQWERNGGQLGGVIHVDVTSANVQMAQAALDHTISHHMDNYLLLISSREDVTPFFPKRPGDPIRWIAMDSCEDRLRF
jgi:hypothetical protein